MRLQFAATLNRTAGHVTGGRRAHSNDEFDGKSLENSTYMYIVAASARWHSPVREPGEHAGGQWPTSALLSPNGAPRFHSSDFSHLPSGGRPDHLIRSSDNRLERLELLRHTPQRLGCPSCACPLGAWLCVWSTGRQSSGTSPDQTLPANPEISHPIPTSHQTANTPRRLGDELHDSINGSNSQRVEPLDIFWSRPVPQQPGLSGASHGDACPTPRARQSYDLITNFFHFPTSVLRRPRARPTGQRRRLARRRGSVGRLH